MPGDEPKAQHFVHRAYLDGFTDSRGNVWTYIPYKAPFPQRPERVAKRNYYYCYERGDERVFDVEHALSKLEDVSLPVLERLTSGDLALNDEDRLTFAGYIALSYCRVPTFQKNMDRLSSWMSAKRLANFLKNEKAVESYVRIRQEQGEKIDVEKFKKDITGGSVVLSQTNRGWSLGQMFKMMMMLQRVFWDMKWTFLSVPNGSDGLVTSDNPVIPSDPVGSPFGGVGFASSPEAYFTFPLSSRLCLMGSHKWSARESAQLSPMKVRELNKLRILHCEQQIYAPFQSPKVQALLDEKASRKTSTGRILLSQGKVVEE